MLRDVSPRNTPPPRDPIRGVVYLRIVLSPEQTFRMWVFLNKVFYREGLLAHRPTPKRQDHPSSAVRDWLFNLFAAILPSLSKAVPRSATWASAMPWWQGPTHMADCYMHLVILCKIRRLRKWYDILNCYYLVEVSSIVGSKYCQMRYYKINGSTY